ncbi:hypothetical protein ACH5RR_032057 [Cinchona calisaya]|uniref:ABC-type xenobiotic transporter n=1 Tax=Cinchona calisaya TaxID=153742 RepID=A0ABD2YH06_9GENT
MDSWKAAEYKKQSFTSPFLDCSSFPVFNMAVALFIHNITPFAEAGFLSEVSFSWLNPLLKKGKEKTLENEDIPELRPEDKAESCYSLFKEQFIEHRENILCGQSSVLSSILCCQRKAILISGFFALFKVVTLSTGPLFLYAFINLAKCKEVFRYEGYALTAGLFVVKYIESLAERQWLFRTRLIGHQIQSMLTAAIYKKQLHLSNMAKDTHSPGEIMNYVTVDAYKIGEFPYWFHQIWTTGLQVCIGLVIIYCAVGLATVPALVVVVLSMLGNSPMAKLQRRHLTQLMIAQDKLLKAITEALSNMKALKGYYMVLFWSTPIIVSAVIFWASYLPNITLTTLNTFTFIATLSIVQEPIRSIPDIIAVSIEAKVSFSRIVKFLEAPELQNRPIQQHCEGSEFEHSVLINSKTISWDCDSVNPSLEDIFLLVKPGEKVASCGDVGSRKSTLLAAIIGEVPHIDGNVEVQGKIAYVSQSAWIQTGTIQQNILFGSTMVQYKYQEVLKKCCLVKDLDMLPFGDQTVIGERGINLSGGQKQRVQLARAFYREADIYLLDDPFSAVHAHTATILFSEYVMEALVKKTVLLVTHQVDFLSAFDSILLMSKGRILKQPTYNQLVDCSQEFRDLVHAHGEDVKHKMKAGHGLKASKSIFYVFMTSIFRAPMSFYDSTPLGRILSRVSSDLSVVDLLLSVKLSTALSTTMTIYFSLGILATLARPILFIIIPMVCITIRLQKFYFASAKELIRIHGTTKSSVASYLSESIAGVMTIRAFGEEDRFFSEGLRLIDKKGSSFFHSFSANEWLIQRLEILCAIILSSSALALSLLSFGASESGEISTKYSTSLQGISCTFEGGHKIGIVGRTGSGKSTLISAFFRLVDPTEGAILIDGLNLSTIGVHDVRSHLSIIPQDPTLFGGSIRYNLDPLSEQSDHEIWEVLEKCQLRDVVQKKEGLNSFVTQDGSNWSMGQRQLLCLGRALLKRRKILVLDEATASIDNATDSIIQKTIRKEFSDCTVISVAHRIPTVMDCTMVLALSDGKVMEYDIPMRLINEEVHYSDNLYKNTGQLLEISTNRTKLCRETTPRFFIFA